MVAHSVVVNENELARKTRSRHRLMQRFQETFAQHFSDDDRRELACILMEMNRPAVNYNWARRCAIFRKFLNFLNEISGRYYPEVVVGLRLLHQNGEHNRFVEMAVDVLTARFPDLDIGSEDGQRNRFTAEMEENLRHQGLFPVAPENDPEIPDPTPPQNILEMLLRNNFAGMDDLDDARWVGRELRFMADGGSQHNLEEGHSFSSE